MRWNDNIFTYLGTNIFMRKLLLSLFLTIECLLIFFSQYYPAKRYMRFLSYGNCDISAEMSVTAIRDITITIDDCSYVIAQNTLVEPEYITYDKVFFKYVDSGISIEAQAHTDDFVECNELERLWDEHVRSIRKEHQSIYLHGIIIGVVSGASWLLVGLIISIILLKKNLFRFLFVGHAIALVIICIITGCFIY